MGSRNECALPFFFFNPNSSGLTAPGRLFHFCLKSGQNERVGTIDSGHKLTPQVRAMGATPHSDRHAKCHLPVHT